MGGIQEDLRNIFNGRSVPVSTADFVMNKADSFLPRTKRNICYIVGTVLFDQNQVLLVQEAKKSCYGTWYLPAGRLEPGETIVDGAKREVKEEAGFECEVTSMVSVEFGSGTWWRFNFTGYITGGRLKTPAEKDAESLQAKWFSIEEVMQGRVKLRATDILSVIESAQHFRSRVASERPLPCTLPLCQPHRCLLHRLALVTLPPDSAPCLLVKKSDKGQHLPAVMIAPSNRSLHESVCCFLQAVFALSGGKPADLYGLLSVEYNGVPANEHDGVCLTTLYCLELAEGRTVHQPQSPGYAWESLADPGLLSQLSCRLQKDNNIPLLDLHGF